MATDLISLSLTLDASTATSNLNTFTNTLEGAARKWETALDGVNSKLQATLNSLSDVFSKSANKLNAADVSGGAEKSKIDKKREAQATAATKPSVTKGPSAAIPDMSGAVVAAGAALAAAQATNQQKMAQELDDAITGGDTALEFSVKNAEELRNEISKTPIDVAIRVADVVAADKYNPRGLSAELKIPVAIRIAHIVIPPERKSKVADMKLSVEGVFVDNMDNRLEFSVKNAEELRNEISKTPIDVAIRVADIVAAAKYNPRNLLAEIYLDAAIKLVDVIVPASMKSDVADMKLTVEAVFTDLPSIDTTQSSIELAGVISSLIISPEITPEIKIPQIVIDNVKFSRVASALKDAILAIKSTIIKITDFSITQLVVNKLQKDISSKFTLQIKDAVISVSALNKISEQVTDRLQGMNISVSGTGEAGGVVPGVGEAQSKQKSDIESIKPEKSIIHDTVKQSVDSALEAYKHGQETITKSSGGIDIPSVGRVSGVSDIGMASDFKSDLKSSSAGFLSGFKSMFKDVFTIFPTVKKEIKKEVSASTVGKMLEDLSKGLESSITDDMSVDAANAVEALQKNVQLALESVRNVGDFKGSQEVVASFGDSILDMREGFAQLASQLQTVSSVDLEAATKSFDVFAEGISKLREIESAVQIDPKVVNELADANELFSIIGSNASHALESIVTNFQKMSDIILESDSAAELTTFKLEGLGKDLSNIAIAIPMGMESQVGGIIDNLNVFAKSAKSGVKSLSGLQEFSDTASQVGEAVKVYNRDIVGVLSELDERIKLDPDDPDASLMKVTFREIAKDITVAGSSATSAFTATSKAQQRVGNIVKKGGKALKSSFSGLAGMLKGAIIGLVSFQTLKMGVQREYLATKTALAGGTAGLGKADWWDRIRDISAQGFDEDVIADLLGAAAFEKVFADNKEGIEYMTQWTNLTTKAMRSWEAFGATANSVVALFGNTLRYAGFELEQIEATTDGITRALKTGRLGMDDISIIMERFSGLLAIYNIAGSDTEAMTTGLTGALALLTRVSITAETASGMLEGFTDITQMGKYPGLFSAMGQDVSGFLALLKSGKTEEAMYTMFDGIRSISMDNLDAMSAITAEAYYGMPRAELLKFRTFLKDNNNEQIREQMRFDNQKENSAKMSNDKMIGDFADAGWKMTETMKVRADKIKGEFKNVGDKIMATLYPVFIDLSPIIQDVVYSIGGIAKMLPTFIKWAPTILSIAAGWFIVAKAAAVVKGIYMGILAAKLAGAAIGGPAAWAGLAAGVAVATALFVGLKSAIDGVTDSAKEMKKEGHFEKVSGPAKSQSTEKTITEFQYKGGAGATGGIGTVTQPTVIGERGPEFAMVIPKNKMSDAIGMNPLSAMTPRSSDADMPNFDNTIQKMVDKMSAAFDAKVSQKTKLPSKEDIDDVTRPPSGVAKKSSVTPDGDVRYSPQRIEANYKKMIDLLQQTVDALHEIQFDSRRTLRDRNKAAVDKIFAG